MTAWRATWQVAVWEFRRLFRWRDQLLGVLFFAMAGAGWLGVNALIQLGGDQQVTLGVVGLDSLGSPEALPDGFELTELPAGGQTARDRVVDGELDALLIVHDTERAELFVAREPAWRSRIGRWLNRQAQRARIEQAQLTPEEVDRLIAPVDLDVQFADADDAETRRAVRPALFAFLMLMVMGVFTGNAYLFTGITGEKQQRVTEQILAILPPQRWIDGKILGIVMMVAVSLGLTFASFAGVNFVLNQLGTGLRMQLSAASGPLLAAFLLFAGLGLLFWFCFFGAVAATINDPNSSSRSSMMFLPLLPAVFVLAVMKNPESTLTWFTSLFPVTSCYVMPTRMVFGDVPTWQVALSIALLAATVWITRLAAGRIFEFGILMHGKEPSWGEMLRAARGGRPEPASAD